MQRLWSASITGTGMSVPDRVVTNFDLEKLMDTSDEWIQQRTGIVERRHVTDEKPSDLALEASQKALKAASLEAKDLDMILVATLSPEHFFPGTSSWLQRKLGLNSTPCMDLRTQCSGFLFALSVAKDFVQAGTYRRVLVCGVEVHSSGLDMTTRGRDVSALFGDGSGAVIVERSDIPERGIMSCHLHSQGEYAEKLWIQGPTATQTPHVSAQMIDEGLCSPQMDGKFVFKKAVDALPKVINESLNHHNLTIKDIDHFFFHQANLRINEFVANAMQIPHQKVYANIQKYGNCSAASIPMLIDETYRAGKIKSGDLLCLAAFGSGFSWGSVIIRW